jgi:hypothetical protein
MYVDVNRVSTDIINQLYDTAEWTGPARNVGRVRYMGDHETGYVLCS